MKTRYRYVGSDEGSHQFQCLRCKEFFYYYDGYCPYNRNEKDLDYKYCPYCAARFTGKFLKRNKRYILPPSKRQYSNFVVEVTQKVTHKLHDYYSLSELKDPEIITQVYRTIPMGFMENGYISSHRDIKNAVKQAHALFKDHKILKVSFYVVNPQGIKKEVLV